MPSPSPPRRPGAGLLSFCASPNLAVIREPRALNLMPSCGTRHAIGALDHDHESACLRQFPNLHPGASISR